MLHVVRRGIDLIAGKEARQVSRSLGEVHDADHDEDDAEDYCDEHARFHV